MENINLSLYKSIFVLQYLTLSYNQHQGTLNKLYQLECLSAYILETFRCIRSTSHTSASFLTKCRTILKSFLGQRWSGKVFLRLFGNFYSKKENNLKAINFTINAIINQGCNFNQGLDLSVCSLRHGNPSSLETLHSLLDIIQV